MQIISLFSGACGLDLGFEKTSFKTDNHKFYYKNLSAGYKMVGNAVPPKLAYHLAKEIMNKLKNISLHKEKDLLSMSIDQKFTKSIHVSTSSYIA